jgi:hypothetical protein
MSFGRWWHGIPKNPIEQDEFGNTRINPLGVSMPSRLKRLFQQLIAKPVRSLAWLVFVGCVGWLVHLALDWLTGRS